MFRQVAAIFLFFSFALQVFNRSLIVLDYFANTASFAKACENKARPLLHCNGKCQMMKKLKEEEKKDQQNPERKSENKDDVVSSQSFFTTFLAEKTIVLKSFTTHYSAFISQEAYRDIFRPPAVV